MPRGYTPKKLPTKLEVVEFCNVKLEETKASKTADETVEQQISRLTEMKAYEDIIAYIEGRYDPSR